MIESEKNRWRRITALGKWHVSALEGIPNSSALRKMGLFFSQAYELGAFEEAQIDFLRSRIGPVELNENQEAARTMRSAVNCWVEYAQDSPELNLNPNLELPMALQDLQMAKIITNRELTLFYGGNRVRALILDSHTLDNLDEIRDKAIAELMGSEKPNGSLDLIIKILEANGVVLSYDELGFGDSDRYQRRTRRNSFNAILANHAIPIGICSVPNIGLRAYMELE